MSRLTTQLSVTIAGLRGPGLSSADQAVIDEAVDAATEAAGNAVVGASTAAAAALEVQNTVADLSLSLLVWDGVSDLVPITTDNTFGVIIGYRRSTGKVELALSDATVSRGMAGVFSSSFMQFDESSSADLVPLLTDNTNGIIIGYRRSTGKVEMPFEGADGGGGSPAYKPLSAAVIPVFNGYNVSIGYGQSLIVGAEATVALSTTQPYSNITFGSGPKSSKPGNTQGATNTSPGTTTVKPLVEDTLKADGSANPRGETVMSGVNHTSALMAMDGMDPNSVVFCASTAGHGGYSIAQLKLTASWGQQFRDHGTEWKARGDEAGKTSALLDVAWNQGEADAGTTRSAYLTAFLGTADDIAAFAATTFGQSFPPHVFTYQLARATGPALALLDAVNARENIHFVAPIYHLPSADGTHLTALGYLWWGKLWGRCRKQVLVDHRQPDCVWPISVFAEGQKVTYRFRTPTRLVFDTTALAPTTDNGFAVQDATGFLALSNMECGKWFPGPDGRGYCDVTMNINRALNGSWKGRYAQDYLGAGLTLTDGKSGNLRDTTTDTFTYSGNTYPLYHVAPGFALDGYLIGA